VKIGLLLHELHHDENDLVHELLHISERHRVDHEIHHVGRDLARWSQEHVRILAAVGERFGVRLDAEPVDELKTGERLREKAGELLGRRPQAALLLLRDLREVHIKASGVSVDWEMLGQAAQGAKDTALLKTVQRCHPDSLRQIRWANGKLKESAPQILLS
jgi:predicted nucleic acid-binding protein